MRIVTTHLGADFDALGSLAAVVQLDPAARIVFPGSQEAGVRRFLAAEKPRLAEVRLRELRRATIEAATVVDCANLRRLGEVGELILKSGCPVTVYDHHRRSGELPPGSAAVTAPVAATCTVMVAELQRRGIDPDAETASLLLLGIFEDTGGLTYPDTTPTDVAAVAWLLERGARLEWVRRYVLRPLEPEQLELLNQLVEGAIEHQEGGARVVVSVTRPSEHVEEAAYVVHRYAEIFDVPVVLALLEVPPQLVVIARSTHPHVDAGRLLGPLGGGGHATAAAARLRGRSAVEVSELLLAEVRSMLSAGWTAATLATPHLHTCPSDLSAAAAKERIVRLRINAMPVERDGELIGTVTRQNLDSAIVHGLGERPVTTVMRPEVPTVAPETPVEELEHLFMEGHARFVVVPLAGGPGIITRMDLYRRLYERQLAAGTAVDHRLAGARPVVHGVGHHLRRVLAPELLDVLATVGEIAAEMRIGAYLVGGAVRDAMLGRAVEDIDVVAEGNAIELARTLAERRGGRHHAHEPFLTAAVWLPPGVRLDLATARTEYYRSPAALPEVATSALRQDLYRRDFTINAMAIDLAPARFGELVDFFGGRRDLQRQEIRVLHSLSFLDDPTRAIRAVRFATRLGFEVAAETAHLVAVAVREGVFDNLSGERLRDELVELLEEEHPVEALAELDRLGVLAAILPGVRWSAALRRFLNEVGEMLAWSRLEEVYDGPGWVATLAALVSRAGERVGAAAAERLVIGGARGRVVAGARVGVETILAVLAREGARPSEIVQVLERHEPALRVVAMAAARADGRRQLRQALTRWMRIDLPLSGDDLVRAGVPAGPALGEALRRARAAVIDGEIPPAKALDHAVAIAVRAGKR